MAPIAPLAVRMRPTSLDEVVGQSHLIFPGSPLELLLAGDRAVSILLFGPPGSGKTSIAYVVATATKQRFVELSATSAGVKEVRIAIDDARKALEADEPQGTVLFVDEIHRFSKAQQDVLLPAVESGTVSLVGATTENPSFSVNSALVSRSILMVLEPIKTADIETVLQRAVDDPRGLDGKLVLDPDAREQIARLSSGDVRQALGRLEVCAQLAEAAGETAITTDHVATAAGTALQRYDRDGDQHYDVISAFIKSMRGSDPDATVYWLERMIAAGEDPRYIARRIVVHASEDVGMADPGVLPVAVAAAQAVQLIGLPEAQINLVHAALAVALAPKSNAVVAAISEVAPVVEATGSEAVPVHLRDAHYPGAKALGHGAGYKYPHSYPGAAIEQQYLPDSLLGQHFYHPTDHGYEAIVRQRQQQLRVDGLSNAIQENQEQS